MAWVQEKGTCDKDFWIDVLLTILGWLPGCVTLQILLHFTFYACLLVLVKSANVPSAKRPLVINTRKTATAA